MSIIEKIQPVQELINQAKDTLPENIATGFGWLQAIYNTQANIRAMRLLSVIEKLVLSEEKIELDEWLKKLEGNEKAKSLLFDNIRIAIQTPSDRARNVMAVIYFKHYKQTPDHFAITAMNGISHLTDEEIDVFIHLTDLDKIRNLHKHHVQQFVNQPKNLPYIGKSLPEPATNNILREGDGAIYPIIFFHGAFQQYICNTTSLPLDKIIQITKRLISINMLQPDYMEGRYGGAICPYGINEYTRKLREVLLEEQQIFS